MKRVPPILVLVLALTAGGSFAAHAAELAIVVNTNNPVDGQSLRELRAVFEQQRQFWKTGERIHLLLQESGRPEKQVMLSVVYDRGDEELKKFWLMRIFKGEIPAMPTTLSSNEAVKRFVNQVPNAIGFIDAATVDDSVKILRIDGKLPGDPDYALKIDSGDAQP